MPPCVPAPAETHPKSPVLAGKILPSVQYHAVLLTSGDGPDLCTAVLCFPTYRRRESDVARSGATGIRSLRGCGVWDGGPGGPTLNSLVAGLNAADPPLIASRVCSTPAHLQFAYMIVFSPGPDAT